MYSVIYKIVYIDLKFNEISLSFSIDSNYSQCLKIWQYHKITTIQLQITDM